MDDDQHKHLVSMLRGIGFIAFGVLAAVLAISVGTVVDILGGSLSDAKNFTLLAAAIGGGIGVIGFVMLLVGPPKSKIKYEWDGEKKMMVPVQGGNA